MVWTGDSGAESVVATIAGHLQQASPELALQFGLVYTKTFRVWFPVDANVVEGDTLVSGSITYSVKAVQQNNVGANTHLELIVQKDG